VTDDSPATCVAVELGGKLCLLEVAPAHEYLCQPRMPLHDDDGIGGASEAEGAAHIVEGVVLRRHLSKMVVEHDPDLILPGEPLCPLNRPIVGGVSLFMATGDRTHLRQCVDPDESRVLDRLAPSLDVLEPALIYAPPSGM